MTTELPTLPNPELQAKQAELRRLRLLAEAMQIKAKGEPTISLAEVKRLIAAKKAADNNSAVKT